MPGISNSLGRTPAAVGLTLEKENLEPFTEAFVATVDNLTGGKIAVSV